jgi:prevent-host-death family protein
VPKVGIRELKNDASEVIRAVREERAEYIVTFRGEPVAVILPVTEAQPRGAGPSAELRTELAELRARIAAGWRSSKRAVELVADQRR